MALQDRINRIAENLNNVSFLEEHNIEKKVEGNLIILNYSPFARSDRYANLCRGTIFYSDGALAVLPLIRFFNLHEVQVANLDWRTALALEKLDGSMIVAWFGRDGKWHLSTKRMVDFLPVSKFASQDKIDLAEKFRESFADFEAELNTKYWYIFEGVFPENRIVTNYEDSRHGLYLLAMRHSQSLQEVGPSGIQDIVKTWNSKNVRYPRSYYVRNADAIKSLFADWPEDAEGVVMVDANFNRIKIKQDSYVRLHHVISNVNSVRNIIDIVLNGESHEVLSYFPEMEEMFRDIEKSLNMLKRDIMTIFGEFNSLPTQKDFALAVKDLPYAPFLFRLRKGEDLKYQFMLMGGKRLEGYLFPGGLNENHQ